MRAVPVWIFILFLSPVSAFAEAQLSLYGGLHGAVESNVSGNGAGTDFGFDAGWQGPAPLDRTDYGVRLVWWRADNYGWGLDFNSADTEADTATLKANGLTRLGFSGGLDVLTVNAYRRWKQPERRVIPYIGVGVGLSLPHLDYSTAAGSYAENQAAGGAVQWVAGASYPLNDRLSLFGELQGSYSVNGADLAGGGTLEAGVLTGAINLGVSLGF